MADAARPDVTDDLETPVALSLPATRADAGRVQLTLRDSLFARVAPMFADPRCDAATRALVREYLTGVVHDDRRGSRCDRSDDVASDA